MPFCLRIFGAIICKTCISVNKNTQNRAMTAQKVASFFPIEYYSM